MGSSWFRAAVMAAILIGIRESAVAAPTPRTELLPRAHDFIAFAQGRQVTCTLNRWGEAVAGVRRGRSFITLRRTEESLRRGARMALTSSERRTTLRRLRRLSAWRLMADAACRAVTTLQTPTPWPSQTPTGVPTAPPKSTAVPTSSPAPTGTPTLPPTPEGSPVPTITPEATSTPSPTATPEATSTPVPTATATPPVAAFHERTEPLTAPEVRFLFKRFAFAATAEDLAACVGASPAVCFDTRLNVWNDAAHRAVLAEARRYLDDNYDSGGFKTVKLAGLRSAIGVMLLESPNQYHTKLALQFLQHRFAIEFAKLGEGDAHTRIAWFYVQSLFNHASNGDIRVAVTDMTLHPAIQLFLDGASSTAAAPGENLPREFWELYTIGQKDPLDPVSSADQYGNLTDIPQLAKAFTVWEIEYRVPPGGEYQREVFMRFNPTNFAPGPKYIFQGTLHEATVETIYDAMSTTFAHPSFYRYWARQILERYLTATPTPAQILALSETLQHTNSLHAGLRQLATSAELYTTRGQLMMETVDLVALLSRTMREMGRVAYPNLVFGRSTHPRAIANALVAGQQEPVNSPDGPFGWHHLRWASSDMKMATLNAITRSLLAFPYHPVPKDVSNPPPPPPPFTYQPFLAGMPPAQRGAPGAVVDFLAALFDIPISGEERAAMIQYLTTRVTGVNNTTGALTIIPRPWPADPLATDTATVGTVMEAVPGVIRMLFMSPQAHLK